MYDEIVNLIKVKNRWEYVTNLFSITSKIYNKDLLYIRSIYLMGITMM